MKGASYREISRATGISLGSLTNLIREVRSEYPELDELRELRRQLPREVDTRTISQTLTALLNLKSRLGVEPTQIPELIASWRRELGELQVRRESLTRKIAALEGRLQPLQEWEHTRSRLAAYGIGLSDLERLKRLLEGLDPNLDPDIYLKLVEEHQALSRRVKGLKAELEELTMIRDALGYSILQMEDQHTQIARKLRLKLADTAIVEAESS